MEQLVDHISLAKDRVLGIGIHEQSNAKNDCENQNRRADDLRGLFPA